MMMPIYLDYAATTPIDFRVAEKMSEFMLQSGKFGNPASMHIYGQQAREAVEMARAQVAGFLHAEPEEIIFTSGATEANNAALKGATQLYQRKGKHIVTMKTEHKSVLDVCQQLEKEGYRVTYLAPEANGLLDLRKLENALTNETMLVSIMHVNNETGVIQDINAIAQLTSSRGILLHVDAAQTPGKLLLDVRSVPVDLLSVCAHKVYGPKGVGALYLRKKPRVRIAPLLHGGGHEQGMRSGTLATHQIVGLGEAMWLAFEEWESDNSHIQKLRSLFLNNIKNISNLKYNVSPVDKNIVPHILNVRFEGMIADAILAQLPMIATSTASACQGKGTEGSYVLRAMGLTEEQAKSSVRFSFGRFTLLEDVEQASKSVKALFL